MQGINTNLDKDTFKVIVPFTYFEEWIAKGCYNEVSQQVPNCYAKNIRYLKDTDEDDFKEVETPDFVEVEFKMTGLEQDGDKEA